MSKLERHEDASDRLMNETDIRELLKMLRIVAFVSKLRLSRHQRELIPVFSKYRVSKLDRKESEVEEDDHYVAMQDPGDSGSDNESQSEDTLKSLLDGYVARLGEDGFDKDLIEHIVEGFDETASKADLGILFEITGYQGDKDDTLFWENYLDIDEAESQQP